MKFMLLAIRWREPYLTLLVCHATPCQVDCSLDFALCPNEHRECVVLIFHFWVHPCFDFWTSILLSDIFVDTSLPENLFFLLLYFVYYIIMWRDHSCMVSCAASFTLDRGVRTKVLVVDLARIFIYRKFSAMSTSQVISSYAKYSSRQSPQLRIFWGVH